MDETLANIFADERDEFYLTTLRWGQSAVVSATDYNGKACEVAVTMTCYARWTTGPNGPDREEFIKYANVTVTPIWWPDGRTQPEPTPYDYNRHGNLSPQLYVRKGDDWMIEAQDGSQLHFIRVNSIKVLLGDPE